MPSVQTVTRATPHATDRRSGSASQADDTDIGSARDAFATLVGSLVDADAKGAIKGTGPIAEAGAEDMAAASPNALAALAGTPPPVPPAQAAALFLATSQVVTGENDPALGDGAVLDPNATTVAGATGGNGLPGGTATNGKETGSLGLAASVTGTALAEADALAAATAKAAADATAAKPNTPPPTAASTAQASPSVVVETAALSAANAALATIVGALGGERGAGADAARAAATAGVGTKGRAQRAGADGAGQKLAIGAAGGAVTASGAPQVSGATAAFEGTGFSIETAAGEAGGGGDAATSALPGATVPPQPGPLNRLALHPASPLMAAALNFAERLRADPEATEADIEALGVSLPGAITRAEGAAPATVAPMGREVTVPLPMLASEIARQVERGKKTFDIRLDPPELGKVRVKLDLGQEGEVRAHLIVERKETLDQLQRDQRTLERALQSAGLDVAGGGLQFSLSSGGQQRFGDPSNGRSEPRPSARRVEGGEAMPPPPTAPLSRHAGGLDVRV